ncbi:KDF1 factor, partial [Atractosteus spatula]|nr:KDF1 factor [Atractosteus spatula]
MPGSSAGSPQKPHYQVQDRTRQVADSYRHGKSVSRDSSSSNKEPYRECSYREYSPEMKGTRRPPPQQTRKAHPRDANGRESETIGFIPGSADNPPSTQTCGSCTSLGWSGCKALICCIFSCGFYKTEPSIYIPCLDRNETSTEDVKSSQEPKRPNGLALSNPTSGISLETKHSKPPLSDSFNYPDIKFKGERVKLEGRVNVPKRTPSSKSVQKGDSLRPSSSYSLEDPDQYLDDLSDCGTDIDSLITKKLLELYKLHQIDQLAKCTSDSVFFRKTSEITELINNIAQDYNLDEQDAECRLVHGVIRISTRKSKRAAPQKSDSAYSSGSHVREPGHRAEDRGRRDGTLPDSGNDTMIETSLTSQETDLDVKISEQTSSDKLARQMRHSSSQGYSSSSPTGNYASFPDAETNSSGTPLLDKYFRT